MRSLVFITAILAGVVCTGLVPIKAAPSPTQGSPLSDRFHRGDWLATTLLALWALWVFGALRLLPPRIWLLPSSASALLRTFVSSVPLLCAVSVLPTVLRSLLLIAESAERECRPVRLLRSNLLK